MKKQSKQRKSVPVFDRIEVPEHLAEIVRDLSTALVCDTDPQRRRQLMAMASVSAAVIAVDVNTRLEAVERRLAAIEATLSIPEKSPE
jgi:hypothetical protein